MSTYSFKIDFPRATIATFSAVSLSITFDRTCMIARSEAEILPQLQLNFRGSNCDSFSRNLANPEKKSTMFPVYHQKGPFYEQHIFQEMIKLKAQVSLYRSPDLSSLSVKKCLKSWDFLSSIITFGHVVSEEKSFEISANQKR